MLGQAYQALKLLAIPCSLRAHISRSHIHSGIARTLPVERVISSSAVRGKELGFGDVEVGHGVFEGAEFAFACVARGDVGAELDIRSVPSRLKGMNTEICPCKKEGFQENRTGRKDTG